VTGLSYDVRTKGGNTKDFLITEGQI